MQSFKRRAAFLSTVAIVTVCAQSALSFRLSPSGTVVERNLARKVTPGWLDRLALEFAGRGVDQFTEPVHEEIANRIYDCQGDADLCANVDANYASPYVLAGVRWNDDPPFQLNEGNASTACKTSETIRFTTQPRCWYALFHDAETRASRGQVLDASTRASLLARSHFGDLQFLHAMASADGELASDTKARIMMWAEFTWKVSRGDYRLDTRLADVRVEGFDRFFGRSEWRVQDLFALGNPVLRGRIKDVAFGSLLHMVQDSFAKGHVNRVTFGLACGAMPGRQAPGAVTEFHSYVHQDSSKHGFYDSRDSFVAHWQVARPNVIDIGIALREFQERGAQPATWDEVKPYFDCMFFLENPSQRSSAGADFARGRQAY